MVGYPQFAFWISITLLKIYFSCIFISWEKNNFDLVGTVLKVCDSEKQRRHYLIFITSLRVVKTLKLITFQNIVWINNLMNQLSNVFFITSECKKSVHCKIMQLHTYNCSSLSHSRGELNLVYLFQTRTSNGVTTVLS